VEARIARIRAKNAELLQRHQEVERDRKDAEMNGASAKKNNCSEKDDSWRSPGRPLRQPGRLKERLGSKRNDDKDSGPPPDPANKFLADRMRDGPKRNDENISPRGRRGGGRGRTLEVGKPLRQPKSSAQDRLLRARANLDDENMEVPEDRHQPEVSPQSPLREPPDSPQKEVPFTPTITDWAEEVANEYPSPEAQTPAQPFIPQQQQPVAYWSPPEPAHHVAYYAPAMVASSPPHYEAGANTSVAHGPHAHFPIMTSQPLSAAGGASHQFQHDPESRGVRGQRPWGASDRDFSRIPQKFHKQRLPEGGAQALAFKRDIPDDLPWTAEVEAPENCRRITLLAPKKEADLAVRLSEVLKDAEVRHLPAEKVDDLYEAVRELKPERDRLVLFHVGSTDAAAVACDEGKTDLEKGALSDAKADAVCDLAEDARRRIPYLTAAVCALPPRFDGYVERARSGMKLPNSVRRFMNVQLSTRIRPESDRLLLLNADEVLDWREDEEMRVRLFQEDGCTLKDEGKDVLAQFWARKLAPLVAEWHMSRLTVSKNNTEEEVFRQASSEVKLK